MTKLWLSALVLLLAATGMLCAQSIAQFRGDGHTGIYPAASLLSSWPEGGPALLWSVDNAGNGYSSPVVAGGTVYLAGETDSTGSILALDAHGKVLWQTPTGREWMENFTGPRCSPAVVDNQLYYLSGMGNLLCLDARTGKENWKRNLLADFHGVNIRFGYTESLLIDGDLLFCSPGGPDTNVVALNRHNGALVWVSKAMGDSAAYCSPVMIDHNGRKIFVTLTIHHLIGLDAATGNLLWSVKYERPNDIHCNTPLYDNGFLYVNDRGGNGLVKLQLAPDGSSVTEVWRNFKAGNVQSGCILHEGFLYGARYAPKRFESIDVQTGSISDSLKFECGSTIMADGLLYCYGEGGTMGLIKPDHGKLTLVSSFKVTAGTLEHFAHPVIAGGILYIRHGKSLMAYDVRR